MIEQISPLALAAKQVIDAAWLHGDAYDLSSQAAFALESTRMLQSPETAAEVAKLRKQVAELESQLEALRSQGRMLKARPTPSPEGEFHSFLHHPYTTSHDWPPMGGGR